MKQGELRTNAVVFNNLDGQADTYKVCGLRSQDIILLDYQQLGADRFGRKNSAQLY